MLRLISSSLEVAPSRPPSDGGRPHPRAGLRAGMILVVLMVAVVTAQAHLVRADAVGTGPTGAITGSSTLRGKFVQERRLQGFQAPLRSEGRFMLAPGRGLIWQTLTPFAVTTVITAAGLVQDSDGAETMRLPAARLPFLAKLYDMLGGALAGDWQALGREFTVVRSGDAAAWQVDLQPRTPPDAASMPIRAIRIAGGRFVEQVDLMKEGGDSDSLRFTGQTLSTAPPDAAEIAQLAGVGR